MKNTIWYNWKTYYDWKIAEITLLLIFIITFCDANFLRISRLFLFIRVYLYFSCVLSLHSLIAATAIAVCRFIAGADLSNGIQWRDVLYDGVGLLPLSVTKPLRKNRPICHPQWERHWISNWISRRSTLDWIISRMSLVGYGNWSNDWNKRAKKVIPTWQRGYWKIRNSKTSCYRPKMVETVKTPRRRKWRRWWRKHRKRSTNWGKRRLERENPTSSLSSK